MPSIELRFVKYTTCPVHAWRPWVELGRADSVTSASLARALAQPPRCSPRPGPPTGHTYTVVDVLGSKMDFSGSGTQASTSAMRATAGELSSALVCSRKNAAACANPSSGGPRRPLRAHCHQVSLRESSDKYCLRLQERPRQHTRQRREVVQSLRANAHGARRTDGVAAQSARTGLPSLLQRRRNPTSHRSGSDAACFPAPLW